MRICKVENCNNKYEAKGHCKKHYNQISKYGKIFERNRTDPNEIIDYKDYYEIALYNKKCEEIARTKIDKDDLEKAKQYKWCLSSEGYVINSKIRLHQLILSKKKGLDIDHINHDTLDNRKQNLRHCTRSQNNLNKKKQCGIVWRKRTKKWEASINIKRKFIYLGSYNNYQEALKIRQQTELKYF